jgi:hypothetical protein
MTPLGVKLYSVRNKMIKGHVLRALKKKYHLAPKDVHGVQRVNPLTAMTRLDVKCFGVLKAAINIEGTF